MKFKKIIISGFIIGILFLLFDMLIGILTNPFLQPYSTLEIWRVPPNIAAGLLFDLINGFILVIVFHILFTGIPGIGWKKGFNYGLIVGLFRVVMNSFSSIVMYNIPVEIIIITSITGYLEIILLCVILSNIYKNK